MHADLNVHYHWKNLKKLQTFVCRTKITRTSGQKSKFNFVESWVPKNESEF
jgi:hypothetical protein